jgi:oxygen-independent coproporphyrinogen-3 oxidase
MHATTDPIEHLYVHVPFCAAKCNYCAFYSEAGSAAKMEDYVEAVVQELESFFRNPNAASGDAAYNDVEQSANSGCRPRALTRRVVEVALEPKTIFFGGGTPSLLPAALIRRLLESIAMILRRGAPGGRALPTASDATRWPSAPHEWTIECNPSTVSSEKAKLFREFGVNRISMGVQALDDELLEKLGRVHSVKAAIASYEKLRGAGFDNINLDLMFGLPGQTMGHWRKTLGEAIALQPEHLSTYCLILEEDTHFWSLLQKGLIKPDEELELAMYETAIETLAAAGYRQYEISNFAKPNRQCAHNIAYWEGKDYLGLGPSACSTVGDRRWQNAPDTDRYIAAMRQGERALAYEEPLTPELRAAERAAFGMRMNAGVPAELLKGRWDKEIAELLSAELVQWRNNRLQPTKRGILFADEVAAQFV